MNKDLIDVLDTIGEKYKEEIQRGSRHYLEVSIGKHAENLMFFLSDLSRLQLA